MENITILAIETSCDETAASVVVNGYKVLSNVISSQIELHKLYGGVVPEIASRKHVEKIDMLV
jgi:N6-L-threonylcarbamoyladenine synthase